MRALPLPAVVPCRVLHWRAIPPCASGKAAHLVRPLDQAWDVGNHDWVINGVGGRHHPQLRGQGGECIVADLRDAET